MGALRVAQWSHQNRIFYCDDTQVNKTEICVSRHFEGVNKYIIYQHLPKGAVWTLRDGV